jgi:hypothetical protein
MRITTIAGTRQVALLQQAIPMKRRIAPVVFREHGTVSGS